MTAVVTAAAVLSSFAANGSERTRQLATVDKTLVAWVAPANLDQQGGSALTIQVGPEFDAIVLGERARGKWMAGSDNFRRTQRDQGTNAAETNGPDVLIQVAIVYEADDVRIYRNGQLYAAYSTENVDLLRRDNHLAVFGLRHIGAGTGTPLAGAIEDARLYARALTAQQIQSLRPNQTSEIPPLAWWDFEGDTAQDRAGRFTHHAAVGGVKLEDGRLVLDGTGYLVAARSEAEAQQVTLHAAPPAPAGPYVPETPVWPDQPPTNWVTFHLAHPGPGPAMPGDPNCIFDYQGRVHLHYIYRNAWGFVFGHVSSDDMVRWKWHKTVLAPPTTGHGMFSGTGFYTRQGRPAIIYHGQGAGRNVIQHPADESFDSWTKPVAVVPKNADGTTTDIRHWDPDCWLMNDTYFAYSGGQNPQLMKSSDLENWTYLGDLLHAEYPADLGVPKNEDISCGNMFQIGDKWMLLCISHSRGARYYLGDFRDEKYLPSFHAMLSFGSNQFFAPESLLTRDGRRVMWAWLLNMPIAPTGVQSLPRELELPADGVLRIRPLRELATLRYDARSRQDLTVRDGASMAIDEVSGDAAELQVTIAAPLPQEIGISLLGDAQGHGGMRIVAGTGRKTLQVGSTEPPFELADNEDLTLRVFIDKNLVEVFANDRQAAVYAVQAPRPEPHVSLYAKGGDAVVRSIQAWRMRSIYAAAPAGDISSGLREER
jgi:sucrose-6-phosphate hydrolase SacC (GH32 family)